MLQSLRCCNVIIYKKGDLITYYIESDNYMLLKISNNFRNTDAIFLKQQRKMIHEKDLRKTAGAL